jgi:two-component system LytT family sensor kinase
MSWGSRHGPAAADRARTRAILALTASFWIGSFVLLSVRGELLGQFNDVSTYLHRLLLTALGGALCWGIQWPIVRYRGSRFTYRALLATGSAAVSSLLYALLSMAVYVRDGDASSAPLSDLVLSTNYWLWFFLAWTGMLLGLVYSFEAIERERQLGDALVSGHLAKITALRYQVNPHFLFNTLNAIASMVPRESKAERLILDLSEFFRITLAIDPVADIHLAQEFEIQTLYLDIEKVRYGERLHLDIDLAEEARRVRVPSLILQPLVENAIKHGVSAARHAVRVSLEAKIEQGAVLIRVRDDGAPSSHLLPGIGIGIENVRQRLQSRYGDAARLAAGPCAGGGFEVTIEIDGIGASDDAG